MVSRLRIIFAFALSAFTLFFSCAGPENDVPSQPNFAEHIAPIIYTNCAPCHRPGGIAPFSLLNYAQVKSKAKTIATVTANRLMPPWPADASYTHFIGEKYLSEAQIKTIARWYEQGAKAGSKEKLITFETPTYRSNLGKPDMVLSIDSVRLLSNYKDRFFLVKIPGIISHDTFLRAVEFVAGEQDLLHHFNGHLILYDWNKRKDPFGGDRIVEITTGEYERNLGNLDLLNDDGSRPLRLHSVVNYLPGVQGILYPEGIGTLRLSRKFAFVGNDMHYGPSERNVTDHSYINLFFTNIPPSRVLAELMLGTNGVSKIEPPLKIPAGKVSKHSTRFVIEADISVLTVNPHMHLLGKSFLAYAIKPNGDTIRLIRINRWDFRWQNFYTFPKMVHIPRGSVIVAEAVFDNTSANPDNPNRPPKEVGERLEFGGASMRATDEMFQFIITYTAYKPGDENFSLESK